MSNLGKSISTNLISIVSVEIMRKLHDFDSLSDFPLLVMILSCNNSGVLQTHMMLGFE